MKTYILGISAYYHDSAAALLCDGDILAAAQEERFTRVKQDASFPGNAVDYCLREAGIGINDVAYVVFYDKPWTKFERLLDTYVAFAPFGIVSFLTAMPAWLKQKFFMRRTIRKALSYSGEILFADHHESHAASAFYPSPYEKAAILTIDGVGEWATATYGTGEGNRITFHKQIDFPHSLGLLYSAFTYYTGFKVNSGEYKLMGLAPYGEPKYVDAILNNLIDIKEDGSFKLNQKYFNYCAGLTMTNRRFDALFGGEPPRKPEGKITPFHMDIAKSIQAVTEIVISRMAKYVRKGTGCENLCMAGGVALNCVANGRLLEEGIFKNIWVQPAASDAGGALGAALVVWHNHLGNGRSANGKDDLQKASLLGPSFSDAEIERFLLNNNIPYKKLAETALYDTVAGLLADEKVVGWFQGRMEFGPRALGSRSILGDARSESMQSTMNLKIKFRESFRPFAPSVLRERAKEYFELDVDSPYMLFVSQVASRLRVEPEPGQKELFGIDKLKVKRSAIPAVTHVDYSARFQTVSEKENPKFHGLLKAFADKTGCPVLINTSFNVRGEPIVCTPEHAFKCFLRTNMDYLALGSFLLDRKEQSQGEIKIGDLSEFNPEFAIGFGIRRKISLYFHTKKFLNTTSILKLFYAKILRAFPSRCSNLLQNPGSNRTDKELRRFGYIFGVIFPLLVYFKWGRGSLPVTAAALALMAYCLTGAVLKPAILKPLHFLLSSLFDIIMKVFSYGALTLCFYLVITPIGLLLRMLGKDVLGMKMDKTVSTCWKESPQKVFPKGHYKNQF